MKTSKTSKKPAGENPILRTFPKDRCKHTFDASTERFGKFDTLRCRLSRGHKGPHKAECHWQNVPGSEAPKPKALNDGTCGAILAKDACDFYCCLEPGHSGEHVSNLIVGKPHGYETEVMRYRWGWTNAAGSVPRVIIEPETCGNVTKAVPGTFIECKLKKGHSGPHESHYYQWTDTSLWPTVAKCEEKHPHTGARCQLGKGHGGAHHEKDASGESHWWGKVPESEGLSEFTCKAVDPVTGKRCQLMLNHPRQHASYHEHKLIEWPNDADRCMETAGGGKICDLPRGHEGMHATGNVIWGKMRETTDTAALPPGPCGLIPHGTQDKPCVLEKGHEGQHDNKEYKWTASQTIELSGGVEITMRIRDQDVIITGSHCRILYDFLSDIYNKQKP